jgi:putative lipoic acid-binding regulatory protein
MTENSNRFQELLDANYCWPCSFPFKFIVPKEKLEDILALFPGEACTSRPSKTGKYVSVTIHKNVCSSEEVVQIYEQVGKISGVICL